MKKNTLLGLTLISCIGVIFAVIFDDKMEETENPTEKEGITSENEEIRIDNEVKTDSEVIEFDVKQRVDEIWPDLGIETPDIKKL